MARDEFQVIEGTRSVARGGDDLSERTLQALNGLRKLTHAVDRHWAVNSDGDGFALSDFLDGCGDGPGAALWSVRTAMFFEDDSEVEKRAVEAAKAVKDYMDEHGIDESAKVRTIVYRDGKKAGNGWT